jgi:hypothetical protein
MRQSIQHSKDEANINTITTSNISRIYTSRGSSEALLDKERVHNFPFGFIKIGGGK